MIESQTPGLSTSKTDQEVDVRVPVITGTAADLIAQLPWNGDRSPIIDSQAVFVGLKQFQPGEVFGNHYHASYDEYFVVVDGQMTIWRGRATKTVLNAGSTLLCDRGSHHYLVNATDTVATILFVKAPATPEDTIWVPWSPEGQE